jgi:aryl-alcohol dehydrogenase-like predicted oxidoreductase
MGLTCGRYWDSTSDLALTAQPASGPGDGVNIGTADSGASIRAAVEGSLKRLGTDHIDLYYQHRVDPQPRSRRPQGASPN